LILALPRDSDASSLAIAQAGAMVAALVTLVAFASFSRPQWPSLRDLATIALANAVMSAALLPMRNREPGLATLAEQIAIGVAVYAFVVMSADVAGLRSITLARLKLTAGRMKTL